VIVKVCVHVRDRQAYTFFYDNKQYTQGTVWQETKVKKVIKSIK